MRPRRTWWVLYGIGAAVVLLALVFNSALVLRLERGELTARAEAGHQEAMRLALWRMDSWLAPRLARESARPFFDYQPFYPPQRAYTRLLHQIEPGEVLTPSPLLSFHSDYFKLHFQVSPDGGVSSPQVPTGNLLDLAEQTYLSTEALVANKAKLVSLQAILNPQTALEHCTNVAQTQVVDLNLSGAGAERLGQAPTGQAPQELRTQVEWLQRQKAYAQNALAPGPQEPGLRSSVEDDPTISVGPLVPLWSGTAEAGQLMFVRQVQAGREQYLQGFLCDWPRLRDALLEQISDLLTGADLAAVTTLPPIVSGDMLATLPVRLEVPPPRVVGASWISPTRSALAVTWLVVIGGLLAVAVTLRAAVAFGEKRSRFASAVTHELRTPLTTFRMYTEMLAEDMVQDPQRRQEYLDTLKDESGRLTTLVENVMSYARLEEGRRSAHRERVSLESLLGRLRPPLQRRAEDSASTLLVTCDAPPETTLDTDVDAVGQILFNLVDNACKYGPGGPESVIHLRVGREDGVVHIDVEDQGPGIPPDKAKAIFAPFERGINEHGDAPGIGLGLALARGLAFDLKGDLTLRPPESGGACFRLTLPA